MKRSRRCLRRMLVPELVDEPVARDDLVRMNDQDTEQRALTGAAQGDLPAVPPRLQRPENPELERAVRAVVRGANVPRLRLSNGSRSGN
ncbi:MAG: hypothetical protein ACRDPV_00625 [Gaiellaceae bacterium]